MKVILEIQVIIYHTQVYYIPNYFSTNEGEAKLPHTELNNKYIIV